MSDEDSLTAKEVAMHYGIGYETALKWIHNRRFPNARKVAAPRGDYYLVPRSDLSAAEIKKCRQKSGASFIVSRAQTKPADD